ncbi:MULTISPECIES: hypothetical protein [Streptomyces]|uniref:Macro domain-containing protein n=2 Tax=Streptomyces TaxID=1883 RepID=A0A124ED76_9ACTN|nr:MULTISPECIES: hypothetical protein [Streptomyces]KUH39893.1 hypothetical protein ATE80_04880 [Streptomyces kanasensis]UUS32249.1 hypothetical protein NRO40_16465 [Streptomyces changanensis]
MPTGPLPDHASLLGEVRAVRRAGLVRLRELDLPALSRAAAAFDRGPGTTPVERLLRAAVSRLDAGTLRDAAAYALGLAQGTRDWPAADRRRRAAEVYGVSVERFRKHHEPLALGQVAEQIAAVAAERAPAAAPTAHPGATHRVLAAGGHRVTLHVHPVDLLNDVDVVVSPANVWLALPEPYKSSVPASLRRAGAVRGPTGELVEDLVHDGLRAWAARHGAAGRPVQPATVAATEAGALAAQGVRRIYHAAVAVPRAGTNDYDVLPADVTRAVTRVFALLREESARFDPPLRSLCLPLLGAGRGGLTAATSAAAVWAAVGAELARGGRWEVHLVVLDPADADALARVVEGGGGA